MTRYRIDESQSSTYTIAGNGHIWAFTRGTWIRDSTSDAIDAGNTVDTTIVLNGLALAGVSHSGIISKGAGLDLTIGADGVASGTYGIETQGADAEITNNGRVFGGNYGVSIFGSSSVLRNNGFVRSDFEGVSVNSNSARIINGADGEIHADSVGINFVAAAGATGRIVNHGLIEADLNAIQMFDGNDIVINDGVIKGRIFLGKGNDTFDTRGGKIDGAVNGGVGDDTLITDNANDWLIEVAGEGADTIKSTVSYALSYTTTVEVLTLIGKANVNATGSTAADILRGNKGDNVLSGLQGTDTLEGFAGHDTLKGGAGADRFIFKTGYGDDKIMDFQQGADEIRIGGWKAIDNFADVKSHARDIGGSVVIEAGHDSLTIRGIQKHELHAGDFEFVV